MPSLNQVFLQWVSQGNGPIPSQGEAVENLGCKGSLVITRPPSPDSASCLAPGVEPAWLGPQKRMEQSKLLQIPARTMATGFG